MSDALTRPASDEYPAAFGRYVERVPGGELLLLLERQRAQTAALLGGLSPEQGRFRYAPGKWSVTEVVGHLADAERVFAYRALRFARGDATPLPGFDEQAWMPAAGFARRPLADVLDEYGAVRAASLALFRSLDAESAARAGLANGQRVTVRALGYVIAGHELHHRAVLRERYGLAGG
jgi:hypothetical protein